MTQVSENLDQEIEGALKEREHSKCPTVDRWATYYAGARIWSQEEIAHFETGCPRCNRTRKAWEKKKKKLNFSKPLALAAAVLISVFIGGAGVVNLVGWDQVAAAIRGARLDEYIQFAIHDATHRSTVPSEAVPLLAGKDRSVWLIGKGEANSLREIQWSVEPGLKAGEKRTVLPAIAIGQDAGQRGVKSFQESFDVPEDGIDRVATIRLIPHDEAKQAYPPFQDENRLTYKVRIACRRDGIELYADPTPMLTLKPSDADESSVEVTWSNLPQSESDLCLWLTDGNLAYFQRQIRGAGGTTEVAVGSGLNEAVLAPVPDSVDRQSVEQGMPIERSRLEVTARRAFSGR